MSRLENLLGVQALALADRIVATGISASESAALVTLLAHPDHGVGWLSEVLRLTDSGATRLVERLVAAGLLRRRAGTDGRTRVLTLTAAGRRTATRLLAERQERLAEVLAPLGDAQRRTLERLLEKMVAGLADDHPTALRTCRLCDRHACNAERAACPLQHTVPAPGGLR
jgi:DNA-binding MarR family transcriptional regulator